MRDDLDTLMGQWAQGQRGNFSGWTDAAGTHIARVGTPVPSSNPKRDRIVQAEQKDEDRSIMIALVSALTLWVLLK